MYETMSISSGLYPNLDLWNANKLQLQLQLQKMYSMKFTGITFPALRFLSFWDGVPHHWLISAHCFEKAC